LLCTVTAQLFNARIQVSPCNQPVKRVAFVKQGGDICCKHQLIQFLCRDQHIYQPRVCRYAVDLFSMCGDLITLYSSQSLQQLSGVI
jgi:hypothetical protein